MSNERILVIGTGAEEMCALCTFAQTLSGNVSACIVADAAEAEAARSANAAELYVLDNSAGRPLEDFQPSLNALVAELAPALVLARVSKRMRLAAGRLAAANRTSVITDVARAWIEDGAVFGEHMVFGGGGVRIEKAVASPAIMLISESAAAEAVAGAAPAELKQAAFVEPSGKVRLVERRERQVESVNLASAKRVVSVGRGFEAEEDLQLAYGLAKALEAEVGCTRPIAEASKWMSRERYIGVSGVTLRPDLFVAVGLSGQVQHMVGANSAKTIVAVNKDKNAPIFKQVDYGLVADLKEALPLLTEKLSAR